MVLGWGDWLDKDCVGAVGRLCMACLLDGRENVRDRGSLCTVYLDSLVDSVNRRENPAIRSGNERCAGGELICIHGPVYFVSLRPHNVCRIRIRIGQQGKS